MMPVPHPLKGDQYLMVGKYDKHWPAANRYFCLVRDGETKADALTKAAAEFQVEVNSLVDSLRRARKRGPIGPDE